MPSLINPAKIIASVADLQTFDGNAIPDKTVVCLNTSILGAGLMSGSPRWFRFVKGYAGSDATSQLVIPPATNPGTGKWVLIDQFIVLSVQALQFSQADASVLFTVPTGFRLQIYRPFLEVGTPWTGGAGSTIGMSSSNANYNTKGDLLGGAAGDAAANLTAGFRGSAGTKIAAQSATQPPVVLVGGDTIRWDRITSAFTAGNANVYIPCHVIL